MIHFLVTREDSFTVCEYLEHWGRGLAGRIEVLYYDDLPVWRCLPAGTYVFAALDRLYPEGLRRLTAVYDQLAEAGPDVRLLNSPRASLLRFPLIEELHRRGLNDYSARRAVENLGGLRFPVFLREEHQHTGACSPLLRTAVELRAALARAVVRGHRLEDLLVVEFSASSNADGFYRKYAAFSVGSEIIPRSLSYGRRWMLKNRGTEFSEPMLAEERDYVLENPHERELARIFEIARVAYGRIDYSVKGGVIRTWEINLNPTIGRGLRPPSGAIPAALAPLREKAKEHFYRRFQAALEAIDLGGDVLRTVVLRPGAPPRGPLIRSVPASPKKGLRRILRPVRPLLDSLVGAVSPILVPAARRAARRRLFADAALLRGSRLRPAIRSDR